MEEQRAKPIHEVIDEGNGYLCNATFCGNCGAEIYSDKCDKCGTIADENAEYDDLTKDLTQEGR